MALRAAGGMQALNQVEVASLEPHGQISVIAKPSTRA
jgi:uncharacterized membrane protein YcaP (DUF421 family)